MPSLIPKKNLNQRVCFLKIRAKVFQLPDLKEGDFDQAFDEIELLGFSALFAF